MNISKEIFNLLKSYIVLIILILLLGSVGQILFVYINGTASIPYFFAIFTGVVGAMAYDFLKSIKVIISKEKKPQNKN